LERIPHASRRPLWASDFVSVRTLTATGVVELYLLFLIHVGSRKVIVSSPTANPDSAWATQLARNASMQMQDWNLPCDYLIIDLDSKYTNSFDAVFEAEDAEILRVDPSAPNLNAYAERWVRTLRAECLDHFLICGESHLRHVVNEFVEHYNHERPHQGVGNVPLPDAGESEPSVLPFPAGEVRCRERLGGLLKHYYRAAA
jgi:putative transposase